MLENHLTLPRHLERAAATLSAALRATGRPRPAAGLDAAVRTRSPAR
ncbi:hypothetical protein ACBI99_38075 [Nonomuraea sp. ATR24]